MYEPKGGMDMMIGSLLRLLFGILVRAEALATDAQMAITEG